MPPGMAGDIRAGDRDALRRIVQEQCVPHYLQQLGQGPCEHVFLSKPEDASSGFAVLADRKGGAHFLLIPTKTIVGLESPEIAAPLAINYFAAAWRARDVLQTRAGYPIPRNAVGLAVNSRRARGQDQLHIHIECLGRETFDVLQANQDRIEGTWTPIDIAGFPFVATRISGEELEQHNPFALLAAYLINNKDSVDAYTLVVAGMEFRHTPGFVVLAGKRGLNGESLLDSTCEVAH